MVTKTRRVCRALSATALATSCAVSLLIAPGAAYAVPEKDAEAIQQEIVQTQHDLGIIAEEYNAAKIELATLSDAAEQAQSAANDALAKLEDEQTTLTETSVGLYKTSSVGSATTILSGSTPQEVIDKLSTLAQISDYHGQSVAALLAGQAEADTAAAAAEQAAADAAAVEEKLANKKADIEAKLPKLEEQLESLDAQERETVMAQAGGHAVADDEDSVTVESGSGGSAKAQEAVQAALSRQGSPYVWAAAGPSSFDCSGLMVWAYAQVGISLPHQSEMQAAAGQSLPVAQAAPGDILWMPGHVGMYIGNGQVVHAPTFGDVVRVVPVGDMGWQSATRIA